MNRWIFLAVAWGLCVMWALTMLLADAAEPEAASPPASLAQQIEQRKEAAKTAVVAPPAEIPMKSAAELGEQAKQRLGEFKLDFEVPKVKNEDEVRQLADQGRDRGIKELEQLSRAYELQAQLAGQSTDRDASTATMPKAPVAGRIVLAVSSSMPEQMLRDYFAQLNGIEEAVVVLRGFIGGAKLVKPTGIWMEKLTRTVPSDFHKAHRRLNIVVDPILYRDLGIERVPAVAWLPGVQDIRHCNQETFNSATIVYGAVSVASALKEINRAGGAVPKALVARLEGQPWQ